jgi:hypothetical protein
MDTKRMGLGAVAVLAVVACGTGSGPGTSSGDLPIQTAPAVTLHGAILDVPTTYSTITEALATARRGDLVRVAPGYYPECIVLVDGVTVEGVAGAMLDGSSCDSATPAVIYADSSVQQGATVRGFQIGGTKGPAIHLEGARAVQMLDLFINVLPVSPPHTILMNASTRNVVSRSRIISAGGISLHGGSSALLSELDIEYTPGAGVRSSESSFTLENSTLVGNAGQASVLVIHGSRATLSNNDIQGFTNGVGVGSGIVVDEVGWAPSQVRLDDNVIHDNNGFGLWVSGRGSRVMGVGNRYERSDLNGVNVTGGASYVGRRESMTGNAWDGVAVLGCEQRNKLNADGSSSSVIIQERSLAVLDDFAITENKIDGLLASCDGQVNLSHGSVTSNVARGVAVSSTIVFPDGRQSSAPSRLSAVWTVFAANRNAAAVSGDSRLVLGTLDAPGMNSFVGNRNREIRNDSTWPVYAQWNWFGTTDAAIIAGEVFGDVTFEPFLLQAP